MMPIWFSLLLTLLQWLLTWLLSGNLSDYQKGRVVEFLRLAKQCRMAAQANGCSEDQ